MELNKTEDNKCCFLHFGRGVQDPLSGDQGGSLDPWTPPPPGSAPDVVYCNPPAFADRADMQDLTFYCMFQVVIPSLKGQEIMESQMFHIIGSYL